MKQLKNYFLVGILMLSGKLFAQSISEKELIGTWKNDPLYDDTIKLIFFEDRKVMVSYQYSLDVYSYELTKYGDEQLVIFKKTKGTNTISIFTAYV